MPALSTVGFHWPSMLWLLLVVPLLVLAWWAIGRRRTQRAAAFAGLLPAMDGGQSAGRLRRSLPPLLMLLALTVLVLAIARPHAQLVLPTRAETVILALDASGSMRATDVAPSRLAAAQAAAKAFIDKQPANTKVGVVAIAGAAALVQSPTENRQDIIDAIDRLQLQRGSALGNGIVIGLSTLLPEAGIDVERLTQARGQRQWWQSAPLGHEREGFKPVPPGSNGSVAIVLVTDGQSNTGVDPLEAAKLASEHGVRVYTVGVGTTQGVTLGFEGWSMRVRLDEEVLKKVASVTHGEYFPAASAAELTRVYQSLTARITLAKKRSTEISALLVAIGAALAALSALLSLYWFNRVV